MGMSHIDQRVKPKPTRDGLLALIIIIRPLGMSSQRSHWLSPAVWRPLGICDRPASHKAHRGADLPGARHAAHWGWAPSE